MTVARARANGAISVVNAIGSASQDLSQPTVRPNPRQSGATT